MSNRFTFKKINKGNLKGWIDGEILGFLSKTFFEDPVFYIQKNAGIVIKNSKLRWAAIFEGPKGKKIFLKRDQAKGWFKYIKYLILPSKAQKEWFITYQMMKKNLPVPKTLGWLERSNPGFKRESYYFSQAVNKGVSLIEDTIALMDKMTPIRLAIILRKFHLAGLFHKDLHAGNFIRDGESFYLTDLHRAKITRFLSLDQKLWNLSQLFYSLKSVWGKEEQNQFLDKYFEGEPIYGEKKDKIIKKIYSFIDQIQKKHWKSRAKRCLKESTEFSVYKKKEFFCYHRRDFPLSEIKRIIQEHIKIDKEKPFKLIKKNKQSSISLIENKICVKQYHYRDLWSIVREIFCKSKAMRAWIGGNTLKARGVNSIKPLALIEVRNRLIMKNAFYIMEAFEPNQELNKYISRGFGDIQEKREFIRNFARWLFEFHEKRLYHKNMKARNILVLKKNRIWNFFITNTEDILIDKKLTEDRLFKNFIQLNKSISESIKNTDRIFFINEYFSLNPIVKNKKLFIKRLVEGSSKQLEK